MFITTGLGDSCLTRRKNLQRRPVMFQLLQRRLTTAECDQSLLLHILTIDLGIMA